MEINSIDLEGHKEIYLLGDTHYPRGKRSKFLSVIDEIKNNKHALMLGLGDFVESIIAPDIKRYNPEEMAEYIKIGQENMKMNMITDQWELFKNDIEPIADKIIGMHEGNHEFSYKTRYSNNMLLFICRNLGIKYLDSVCITRLNFGKKSILLQTEHGVGGGISHGYSYNQLKKFADNFSDVDIVAAGHTHKLGVNISIAPMKINFNKKNSNIEQKIQYHCSCGSFLTNYEKHISNYGERKLYPPLPLGYIKVIIDDGYIKSVVPIPI